jgi:hypothetical protein
MILFGWGKTTRKFLGKVFERICPYCNRTDIWQLCIIRTWFTLFFIPVFPYKIMYSIACPNCGSYMEMTKAQFQKIEAELKNGLSTVDGNFDKSPIAESLKYAGKTETQINYLKQMEEFNN